MAEMKPSKRDFSKVIRTEKVNLHEAAKAGHNVHSYHASSACMAQWVVSSGACYASWQCICYRSHCVKETDRSFVSFPLTSCWFVTVLQTANFFDFLLFTLATFGVRIFLNSTVSSTRLFCFVSLALIDTLSSTTTFSHDESNLSFHCFAAGPERFQVRKLQLMNEWLSLMQTWIQWMNKWKFSNKQSEKLRVF